LPSHRNPTDAKGRTMRSMRLKAVLPLLLLLLTLGLAACGGGEEEGGQTAADFPPPTAAPDDAKEGGTLTIVNAGDIDFLDPGAAYYQNTYILDYATQRALLGWPPDKEDEPQPALADGPPQARDA